MVDGVAIRRATPADARAIAEVHVASWRWAYRDELPAAFLDGLSVDERERGWRGWLASPLDDVLVAEEDGRVVGFCGSGPSRDDDADAATGEVRTIYLVEEAAGRGIGRALLEATTASLSERGFARATLWVLATNTRSRRFYERAGWVWDGTTREHRFDRVDLPIVRYATEL